MAEDGATDNVAGTANEADSNRDTKLGHLEQYHQEVALQESFEDLKEGNPREDWLSEQGDKIKEAEDAAAAGYAAATQLEADAPQMEHGGNDGGPGALQLHLADGALARAYVDAAHAAKRKVNMLVERSLLESCEAGGTTFFIEAPGNDKRVFSCRLGDEDMAVFVQVFDGQALSQYVSRLDLSCNLLTDWGAEQLARGLLPRATRLMSLSLRANSIGLKGCDFLCQALSRCQRLQRLDLSQNPLGRNGGLMVVELLQESPTLLELFLGDTEIDIDVIVALSSVLLTNISKLKVLNIENPRISTLQEDHTVHLGRMLRVNTNLSEMYLGKHKMRDEGVRQLVSFLVENKTLRVLDLRCNELGAEGARHLGVLLADDCQLSVLNLSGNRIGEKSNVKGAKALADSLLNNRMLRHLDLNHNEICGEGLQLLGESIRQNSTLESLALFHSQWDQASSYKFHQILKDRARILPLRPDFTTSEVDLRIDICKVKTEN